MKELGPHNFRQYWPNRAYKKWFDVSEILKRDSDPSAAVKLATEIRANVLPSSWNGGTSPGMIDIRGKRLLIRNSADALHGVQEYLDRRSKALAELGAAATDEK